MAGWGEKMFYEWLTEQRDRHDPVGDFARDAWQDAQFPHGVSSRQDLISYMESRGAREDAREAAREAWDEYGAGATDFTPPDQIVDWEGEDDER
jgi:uncharacterized protein YozE (UPF0346 family)